MDERKRCAWCTQDPLYQAYHDEEWGRPIVGDDRRLYELLVLEMNQAGLSWITVLRKREHFRRAFDGFDMATVAAYGPDKVEALRQDAGIIRNRAKIQAAVFGAGDVLAIQREHGSFSDYLWAFVQHQPIIYQRQTLADVPEFTPQAQAMSAALKQRGWRFVGPTVCYAFMQSAGLVNDHIAECWLAP